MTIPESFQSRSFRFALAILKFYRHLKKTTDLPSHITHQMMRAGTSIGAHMEEARSAYSRRDLAAKYAIGLREARECGYWLRIIAADQPKDANACAELGAECSELVAVLTTTVRKLRGHPPRSL